MGRLGLFAMISAVVFCCSVSSDALVGAGVHWGFDFSLDMDDVQNESAYFTGFSDSAEQFIVDILSGRQIAGYTVEEFLETLEGYPLRSGMLPITISRTDWSRTVFNFGGKVFVDAIPIIDALELSMNFGVWEYEGLMNYPVGPRDGISDDPQLREKIAENPGSVTYSDFLAYESLPVTLEEFDMSYFGLSKTPFVKLQFDLSARKYVFKFPKRLKIFRLYAGGGLSVIFNTPALTGKLVSDVMGEMLAENVDSLSSLPSLESGDKLREDILNKMMRDFQDPTFGINLLVGTMVKIPIIPLGLYGDLKYVIPFGELEDAANISGNGFSINLGLTFTL